MHKKGSGLYLVTNSYPGIDLIERVEMALRHGISIVQYREKDRNSETYVSDAFALKELCARYGSLFVVNDDVDLAVQVDADGVHIGQSDMNYLEARGRMGSDKVIGVSCYTIEQALTAQRMGADYVGIHTWESVQTKPSNGSDKPVGINYFREITQAVSIPVVAIGGITLERVSQVFENGGAYAAMVSAILLADDVGKTVSNMNEVAQQYEMLRDNYVRKVA